MSKLTLITILAILKEKHILMFSSHEFCRLFALSSSKGKYVLETNTKKGLFIRLKKGLYALADNVPNEELIANVLYRPSYLSLEYILAKSHIIPETVYHITSVTTKPTRTFTVQEKIYSYTTINPKAYTGYVPIKKDDGVVLIAHPEKALIDYLYLVSLGKRTLNERINTKGLSMKKCKNYSKLFNRPDLLNLLQDSSP